MPLCNRVYVHAILHQLLDNDYHVLNFLLSKYEERQKKKRKSKKPNPENITERNL